MFLLASHQIGVSVSGSVPGNGERKRVPGSRERERKRVPGSRERGTRNLLWVPRSREPGTRMRSCVWEPGFQTI
jgi:hypothetical protein